MRQRFADDSRMMNDDSRDDRATSPGLIVPAVVDQHVEELAGLWNTRQVSLESGHVALRHLARLDERIAAHEDGCLVAGGEGTRRLREQLADAGAAQAFAAATAALNAGDRDAFLRLAAIAEAAPKAASGIASALGWLEPDRLAGIVRELLTAQSPHHRRLGLTVCRLHAVDPGSHLLTGLRDAHPGPRVEALRCAGTLGRTELVPECSDALHHADPEVQLWAAWSMVLLGDRGSALDALTAVGRRLGRHTSRAFRLSIQAMRITAAHGMLQELAADPQRLRRLVHGSGVAGDPAYVPWLIGRMSDDKTSRAAGEAFSLVTGADLALLDLERRPPEDLESGPNDDPD